MSCNPPNIVASQSFGPQSVDVTLTAVYTLAADAVLRVSRVLSPAASVSSSTSVYITWTDSGVSRAAGYTPSFNAGDGQQLQEITVIHADASTAVSIETTGISNPSSTNFTLYCVVEEI